MMKNKVDYTLYLCTDRELMSKDTLEESVEQAILGGTTIVQLREKNCSSREFYDTAVRVKKITDKYQVPLIINDRADIALAVDASGVHVGQGDLPAETVRKMIGPDKILGVSAATLEEAVKAQNDGADYLGVGAMYATETKTDARHVTMEELKEIRSRTDIPIVVIGGINHNTLKNFKGMGIDGLAVVSAVIAADDIKDAARRMVQAFRERKGAIFDLDGTILDSMGVWEKVDIEFMERRKIKLEEEYLKAITPMGFREAAEYTINRYKLSETAEAVMKEWFESARILYAREVGLKKHARDYLQKLSKRGVKIAAATSSEPELYEEALKHNGVLEYFQAFAHTSEVKKGKESADVYLKAAEKIKVRPEECMVFEDILKGIKSAKDAGFYTVAVEDSYSAYEGKELKEAADMYITDYKEMEENQ